MAPNVGHKIKTLILSLVESADSGPPDDSLKHFRAIRKGNGSMVTKLEECALELLQNSGQEASGEKENMAMKLGTIAKMLKTKLDYLAKLDEEFQIEEIEKEVDEAMDIWHQSLRLSIELTSLVGWLMVEEKEWSIHSQAPLRGVQIRWMSRVSSTADQCVKPKWRFKQQFSCQSRNQIIKISL